MQTIEKCARKLPYVGSFSTEAKRRLRKQVLKAFSHRFRHAYSSFKFRNMFSVKYPVAFDLRSRVVYKFTCAGCNPRYAGETSQHILTRICEHLRRDRSSHISNISNTLRNVQDSILRAASPF